MYYKSLCIISALNRLLKPLTSILWNYHMRVFRFNAINFVRHALFHDIIHLITSPQPTQTSTNITMIFTKIHLHWMQWRDHQLTKDTQPDNLWTGIWHSQETRTTQQSHNAHLQPAKQHRKTHSNKAHTATSQWGNTYNRTTTFSFSFTGLFHWHVQEKLNKGI